MRLLAAVLLWKHNAHLFPLGSSLDLVYILIINVNHNLMAHTAALLPETQGPGNNIYPASLSHFQLRLSLSPSPLLSLLLSLLILSIPLSLPLSLSLSLSLSVCLYSFSNLCQVKIKKYVSKLQERENEGRYRTKKRH